MSGGSGDMSEQEWELHNDFLRNEEKERYNRYNCLVFTSTPTAPTIVSTSHHGQKQATSLTSMSGVIVDVGKRHLLVRPCAPPAGPE